MKVRALDLGPELARATKPQNKGEDHEETIAELQQFVYDTHSPQQGRRRLIGPRR